MADSWTGRLLDAHCAHAADACYAKRLTTRFLLDVNGKNYHLDSTTNRDVRSALIERKGPMKTDPATATITGRIRTSGRIHAHTIALN
jgi:hypothetical protein